MISICIAAFGCRGERKSAASDTAAILPSPSAETATPSVNTGWDTTEAGPVMLLSGSESMANAAVVLPGLTDSALAAIPTLVLEPLSNMPVDLFSPAGLTGIAALVVSSQKLNPEGCVSWPTATLSPPPGREWRFAFRKGIATALPLDSLEGMTPADSSQVTIEIARIASVVAEGNDPAFRGLPFVVRRAYRFSLGSTSVVVADVVRKISEEANPREEHLLLVAERSTTGNGKYVAAFESRVAGSEEVIRTNEILGVVRFMRGKPAIIVTFEYEEGGKIALLERTGEKQWRITWRSAYAGC